MSVFGVIGRCIFCILKLVRFLSFHFKGLPLRQWNANDAVLVLIFMHTAALAAYALVASRLSERIRGYYLAHLSWFNNIAPFLLLILTGAMIAIYIMPAGYALLWAFLIGICDALIFYISIRMLNSQTNEKAASSKWQTKAGKYNGTTDCKHSKKYIEKVHKPFINCFSMAGEYVKNGRMHHFEECLGRIKTIILYTARLPEQGLFHHFFDTGKKSFSSLYANCQGVLQRTLTLKMTTELQNTAQKVTSPAQYTALLGMLAALVYCFAVSDSNEATEPVFDSSIYNSNLRAYCCACMALMAEMLYERHYDKSMLNFIRSPNTNGYISAKEMKCFKYFAEAFASAEGIPLFVLFYKLEQVYGSPYFNRIDPDRGTDPLDKMLYVLRITVE